MVNLDVAGKVLLVLAALCAVLLPMALVVARGAPGWSAAGGAAAGALPGALLAIAAEQKVYLRPKEVTRTRGQRPWVVIAATMTADAVVTAAAFRTGGVELAVAGVMLVPVGVWITIVDLDVHRIPNPAVAAVGCVCLGHVAVDVLATGAPAARLVGPMLAAVLVAAMGATVAVPGRVGIGDVKLAAAMPPALVHTGTGPAALVATAVLGLATAAWARLRYGTRMVPAGPAIILGALIALTAAPTFSVSPR